MENVHCQMYATLEDEKRHLISSEYFLVKFANKEAVVIDKFTKVRVLLDGVDVDLLKRFVHTINTHFEDVKLELEMRAVYD